MAKNCTLTLTGNLGNDPQMKTDSTGNTFVHFSLCTTDSYQDKTTGEWQDKAPQWHTVFVFLPKLKETAQYYRKGQRFTVEGGISYRPYKDANGNTRNEMVVIAHTMTPAPLSKKTQGQPIAAA